MSRLRRVIATPVITVGLVLTLAAGVAWASWSAGSAPGGAGAGTASTVEPGTSPTAVSAASAVTVNWAAATLADGSPVTGYLITRYDAATLAVQAVAAGCAGRITTTTCTETGLPDGRWDYTVTPAIGAHWTGTESPLSQPVTTDATGPTNTVTTEVLTGNAAQVGTAIFYRGLAAGSFTLTNAVVDAGSGPASSSTMALAGDASGWTHPPSTVSAPVVGPYVSNAFSWSTATTSAPTETVTGRDAAGNATSTTLSFVNDSTPPTDGTVNYPDGYQSNQSVSVVFTTGTDGGSGIAARQLQRSDAVLTDGVCGSFSGFTAIGSTGPASPYADTEVSNGFCYSYRYVLTDQVGNEAIATSASVAKLDPSAGGPALGAAGPYSVLAGTGVVNTLATSISGDLGVSPSTSITGFPPGTVSGTIHAGDSAAATARSALVAAYNDAAARVPIREFAGDQNGQTFTAGTYHTTAAFGLTGTLTLDGQGDPNAVFVFQVGAALNTAAASQITLINGADAGHVLWQVAGAAGTGANSTFAGTIMAAGAVTLGDSTQLIGRALSYGTITLSNNVIRFTTALPPVVAIDGGAAVEDKNVTPTIAGTTSVAAGSAVTVTVAGQVLTTAVHPGGLWSVTATALPAETYPVTATVRDPAGNAASATQALTIEVNPPPILLNTASTYSVLTAANVVGTGISAVAGDLGVSPGSSVTGFPPGTVAGAIHTGDPQAAQAESDLVLAYTDAASRRPSGRFTGDQNGQTWHEGIHHTDVAFALTGTLTLDAQGDPDAVFIIQAGAALDTAASSHIVLANGAQASHVFWQVAGAAGTGANSTFAGTILAAGAVTLGDRTVLIGQALSYRTITLANDTITGN
jgi:hypothetical protein